MPLHPASLRLVVDHNVWVSYLLTRSFAGLDAVLDREQVHILYTEYLLDDLASVLMRPKLARHLDEADVEAMFQHLRDHGICIKVRPDIRICRDPDDDHLLTLSKDGRADILITGDEDLFVLKTFGRPRIQSPAEFLREYR